MAYWLTKLVLWPFLRLGFRVRTVGLEHVPARGAAILACNHLSFCDSLFLPLVLRRRLTYVAKAEYFDDRRTSWFFRACGQIPIRRGGGAEWRRALEAAVDVVGQGQLLGIYPEGTRSNDGRLHRGHTGIAMVALRTGAPVIPVGLIGTREAQPIGRRIPRPFHTITVRIGAPLDFPAYRHRAGERLVLRYVTDTVMAEIQRLSGQDYAGHYARTGPPDPAQAPRPSVAIDVAPPAPSVPEP
jgi:1-acyl-sn-glycerol-3-phosphate acyltransferase